jgi:methionine-rich copper-binding protein CopC
MSFPELRMRIFRNLVAIAMASLMVMNVAPIGLAHAKMVTTDQVIDQSNQSDDRAQVLNFLMREDVQQHMTRLGVDPEEAKARVASLSDEEVQKIAGRLDELPAGEGIGVVVAAILIIFLVLLITDLVGVTDVFPFVKKKAQ